MLNCYDFYGTLKEHVTAYMSGSKFVVQYDLHGVKTTGISVIGDVDGAAQN